MQLATLYYKDEDGEQRALGKADYPDDVSQEQIKAEMMDAFWDCRLDGASCSPVLEVEDSDDEID